jgi:hypothetical protein
MPDIKNVISRRSPLKSTPLAAAAVSLDGLTPGEATAQQTKLSQALSKYQDTAKKPAAVLYLLAFRCAGLMRNSRRSRRPAGLVPVLCEALIVFPTRD